MRTHPTLFDEHAALITVISMQLIVVFGTETYDVWDFVVSALCLWFGMEAFKIGYCDKLGRLLIAANVGISGTFAIIYAIAFCLYFAVHWWFGENAPVSVVTTLPFTEYTFRIRPSGEYSANFQTGEVLALLAILPAWVFCKRRL